MGRRMLGFLGGSALLVASAVVLPLDGAEAHNCTRVSTYAPTSTTIGSTDCPHGVPDHFCVKTWHRHWEEPVGDVFWYEAWICIDE